MALIYFVHISAEKLKKKKLTKNTRKFNFRKRNLYFLK